MQEEEEVEEKGQEENDTSFFDWPPAPDLLVPLLLVLVLLFLTILLAWLLHRLVHLENIVAEHSIAHQAEKEKRQTGAAEARIVSSSQADHLGRYQVLGSMSVWDNGPPPYPQISNYDHFCPKLHFKDRH